MIYGFHKTVEDLKACVYFEAPHCADAGHQYTKVDINRQSWIYRLLQFEASN